MLEVYRAAADLQRRCQERAWRFCLIGGLALIRQHGRLDWAYVESQLQPLVELKDEPEILERLTRLQRQC